MADQWTCERCGGELEEGFIPNYLEEDAALGPLEWVEGAPRTSFWTGLKTRGRRKFWVGAFRCGSCGRLELFAQVPVTD